MRTILLPCCWSWSPTEVRLLDADHRVSNSASDLVESNTYSMSMSMSTSDQLLYSALHGTALRYAAERRNLDEAIEELRQIAAGDRSIKYFETG